MSTPSGTEAPPGDTTVAPWGASVVGVRALAIDVAAEGRRPGQLAPRISDATVAGWIASGAAYIGARTALIAQLPATREAGSTWLLVATEANELRRHLVQLYAAALLLDITHPTGLNGRAAGAPLREQMKLELTDLRSDVDAAISSHEDDTDPGTAGVQTEGAGGYFPPATITTRTGF